MVVQRAFLPNPVFLARLDKAFYVQIGEDFEEEHTAEQGQQQFLVHDNGRNGDESADGQATCVAHKDLGRVRVEPQEAYQGTNKGSHEYDEFLAARDIHHIEVARRDCITGDVGQYDERQAYDGRIA